MENIENEYGNRLKEIKVLLGISDELQDELLTLVIQDSEERILSVLNQYAQKNGTDKYDAVPDSLNYILRDVSIKRFNKRNSEGTSSDSEEGRSFTWEKSYLDEYLNILDKYAKPEIRAGKGIARFLP